MIPSLFLFIEVVTNGICSIESLQQANTSVEVRNCDFASYPGLVKDRSRIGQFKERICRRKTIQTSGALQGIIFMNIPPSANRRLNLYKLPKEKMVLFMWEPPVRLRKMYDRKIQECFSKIYTWNDDLVDNKTYFKFYYPELKGMREAICSFEEKKLCTTVIGATSDKSRHHPNELYSHRINAIRYFEAHEPTFRFYGRNWDKEAFPSYEGEVEDKIAAMQNYRFAICYENCQGLPGYITEKIFDCFAAGVVPIYLGASNITDYIPKECFIDRREFASLEELHAHLLAITEEEHRGYLEAIRLFIQSEKAQRFSPAHYQALLHGLFTKQS